MADGNCCISEYGVTFKVKDMNGDWTSFPVPKLDQPFGVDNGYGEMKIEITISPNDRIDIGSLSSSDNIEEYRITFVKENGESETLLTVRLSYYCLSVANAIHVRIYL